MALFVRQNEQRSALQEKLAAELKGKLKTRDIQSEKVEPAFFEDSHQARPIGLVIGVLLLVVFAAVVVSMFLLG